MATTQRQIDTATDIFERKLGDLRGKPYVELHETTDPNFYVDEAVVEVCGELDSDAWLVAVNAVANEYDRRVVGPAVLKMKDPCFRCGTHLVTKVDTYDEGFIGVECTTCDLYSTIDQEDIES